VPQASANQTVADALSALRQRLWEEIVRVYFANDHAPEGRTCDGQRSVAMVLRDILSLAISLTIAILLLRCDRRDREGEEKEGGGPWGRQRMKRQ
jgi:hypothetical protein